MKQDSKLRDIPIIVVSALDGEMDSVVRAIENGAQDFLRKNFDPVLLNARIGASLEVKRNRDRELAYLREVERLTDAAGILENQMVNPQRFHLDDISARTDALGRLARVFTRMTTEVYQRERRLHQQVRTLKGVFGLLAIGVISGLWAPLSRSVALIAPHPLTTAFWVNIVCAFLCIAVGAFRGKLFKVPPSLFMVFVMWGVLGTLVGEVTIFWAAEKLEAWILSLVVVTEGFMAFLIATMLRIERGNMRRLLGFIVGVLGVFLVIYSTSSLEGEARWAWVLVAAIGPLGYATRGLMLSVKLPQNLDRITATGYSAIAAAAVLLPLIFMFEDFYVPGITTDDGFNRVAGFIIVLGTISAISCSLRVILIKAVGAVFASQSSIVVTVCGIAWGALLLGERLPTVAWGALVLMLIGLVLVGPKEEDEDTTPIFGQPDLPNDLAGSPAAPRG